MADPIDETKPDEPVVATPDAPVVTTPPAGSDPDAPVAPAPVVAPSQEDFEALKQKYDASVQGMNEAQRNAAAAQAAYEQQLRIAQAAQGQVQQYEDPVKAAWDDYVAAKDSYEPGAADAAMLRWADARDQQNAQRIRDEVLQTTRLQQSLPRAQEMLGVKDPQLAVSELQQVQQTLTPEDLALIRLHRQGKAGEYLSEKQTRREELARQASLLTSMSQGSPGRGVPGPAGEPPTTIDFADWALLDEKTKQELRDSDQEVAVVNGPAHFDPNTG